MLVRKENRSKTTPPGVLRKVEQEDLLKSQGSGREEVVKVTARGSETENRTLVEERKRNQNLGLGRDGENQ